MSIYETVSVKKLRNEFQEMDQKYMRGEMHMHEIMERCYELGAKEAKDPRISEEKK